MRRILLLSLCVMLVAIPAFSQTTALTNFAFIDGRLTCGDSINTMSLHMGLALQPKAHTFGFISMEAGTTTAGAYGDVAYLFGSRKFFGGPVAGVIDIVTADNISGDQTWYWINASGFIVGTQYFNAYVKYKAKLSSAAHFPQGWCFGLGVHFPIKLP